MTARADATPQVMTTHGPVRGRLDPESGVASFLGIPYAASPVGPRRFRPPQPLLPRRYPHDASTFGPAAAQLFDPHEALIGEYYDGAIPQPAPLWVGSEDCLTLNVWTQHPIPARAGALRPMIVWVHGGANWLESSRLSVYHGTPLAQGGDVVFVSLNYRLGVFGFLDVSVLGGEPYRGSHSLGLLDQLAAIEWIYANAAAFGGDPGNITLMGESAGSMDISWLLSSGRLPAGVRRAILMSGVAGLPGRAQYRDYCFYDEAEGRRQARELLELLSFKEMDELLRSSTDCILGRLADARPSRDMLFFWDSLFYPRIDGEFLKQTPFDWFRSGAGAEYPLLIGSTAHEMGLWLLWDPQLDQRSAQELALRLPGLSASQARALGMEYDQNPSATGDAPGMELLGDGLMVMPGIDVADALAHSGGQAWVYQFAWSLPDNRMKAAHAADVGFFLGTHRSAGAQLLIGPERDGRDRGERDDLSAGLRECVSRFAKTGVPGPLRVGMHGCEWPAYDPIRGEVLRIDLRPSLLRNPYGARRERWMRHVYA